MGLDVVTITETKSRIGESGGGGNTGGTNITQIAFAAVRTGPVQADVTQAVERARGTGRRRPACGVIHSLPLSHKNDLLSDGGIIGRRMRAGPGRTRIVGADQLRAGDIARVPRIPAANAKAVDDL